MTRKIILLLACAVSAFALNANAFTKIHFQENGDIGPTYIFGQDVGVDLTLSAFLTAGGTTDLYVINGAGTTGDPGQTEIGANTFIQLTVPTSPVSNIDFVSIGDIENGESALVYFTHTAGSLSGATLLGTLTADGSVTIGSLFQNGFIDITAGAGSSVLLTEVQISAVHGVPDAGSTASLLGMGLIGLTALRRKLHI
ncbi:MAG: VPDSG-CTERM sorting domain-containing protein [Chthoniobacterales bacterium]